MRGGGGGGEEYINWRISWRGIFQQRVYKLKLNKFSSCFPPHASTQKYEISSCKIFSSRYYYILSLFFFFHLALFHEYSIDAWYCSFELFCEERYK